MVKKTTLNELGSMVEHIVNHMATKEDIADMAKNIAGMATKDQVIALHTQVNSIESQLKGMNHMKLENRVADLEDKVFGGTRA